MGVGVDWDAVLAKAMVCEPAELIGWLKAGISWLGDTFRAFDGADRDCGAALVGAISGDISDEMAGWMVSWISWLGSAFRAGDG